LSDSTNLDLQPTKLKAVADLQPLGPIPLAVAVAQGDAELAQKLSDAMLQVRFSFGHLPASFISTCQWPGCAVACGGHMSGSFGTAEAEWRSRHAGSGTACSAADTAYGGHVPPHQPLPNNRFPFLSPIMCAAVLERCDLHHPRAGEEMVWGGRAAPQRGSCQAGGKPEGRPASRQGRPAVHAVRQRQQQQLRGVCAGQQQQQQQLGGACMVLPSSAQVCTALHCYCTRTICKPLLSLHISRSPITHLAQRPVSSCLPFVSGGL